MRQAEYDSIVLPKLILTFTVICWLHVYALYGALNTDIGKN